MTPTPRQFEVLQFIRDFHRNNGKSPTRREIASHLGISPNGAQRLVWALERRHLIQIRERLLRGIRLPNYPTYHLEGVWR